MPEEPHMAVDWMLKKVIKAVGDAKMLGVQLQGLKHQQSLRRLLHYMDPL